MLSRRPTGSEILGAAPGHGLAVPVLRADTNLRTSCQQALLDLQAIQRIPGLVGYWKADPQYLFEDSAGTTPASTNGTGPVGQWRAVGVTPTLTAVTVANSGFDADSDWTKGTGWTIGSGVATKTAGAAASLSQAITLTAGSVYLITWTLTRTAGTLLPRFTGGTTVFGTALSASGTYSENLVAVTGNTTLEFYGDASFAGTVDDVSVVLLTGVVAVEATTALKPTLRKTPTTGIYWADSNTSTSALNVALGNLGSACTVARSGAEGVTFTEGVTISSTYNLAPAFSFNSDVALFNRALTATEKALVTRYMQRGVPVLGSNVVTNGKFDDGATGWSVGTNWSIGGGIATKTGGAGGVLVQAYTLPVGSFYAIRGDFTVTAGAFNFYVGGSQVPPSITSSSSGLYVVARSAGTNIGVNGNTTSAGTLDNLSFRQIL